jgi:hypothetical protein
MLQNCSNLVNDPILFKSCLGSIRVEHSIQHALIKKATNKIGTMKAGTVKRMKFAKNITLTSPHKLSLIL